MTKVWGGSDFIATLGGQRSELLRSLLRFIATPGGEPEPFRDCGGQSSFRVCGEASFRDAGAVIVPRLRR